MKNVPSRQEQIDKVTAMAQRMRRNALKMAFQAGSNGAHLGPGLSIMEITASLYGAVMRFDPADPRFIDRDRFILSKGHGSLGYYTALAEAGIISTEELFSFEENGGLFPGQPAKNIDKGIEVSSGSLGLGLSIGIGIALDAKRKGKGYTVYVLLGDGECNEGTVWEAAMAAAHFHLDNIVAIVDNNSMQSDGPTASILDMIDLPSKWKSFGWYVKQVNGHDPASLLAALIDDKVPTGSPSVVIAKTIKGKGVSFMENNNMWHHNRLTKEQYDAALKELGE